MSIKGGTTQHIKPNRTQVYLSLPDQKIHKKGPPRLRGVTARCLLNEFAALTALTTRRFAMLAE
ncbi:hypothetical protein GCM10023352_05430 [Rothia endophytica]|uniref:Uncharacterized protein n=1 Tax=Rothia endophytica TaxID=1324766 RepID=A0ABP9B4L4_9MICC